MSQPLLFCAAYAAFCSFGQSIWDSPLSARRSRVCPPSGVSVNSTSRELLSLAAAPADLGYVGKPAADLAGLCHRAPDGLDGRLDHNVTFDSAGNHGGLH